MVQWIQRKTLNTHNDLEEFQGLYAEWKKVSLKMLHAIWFCLYIVPEMAEL